ncbi:MAG: hypothetical protein GTN76_00665 [Candidatus Aenigmarchaeota archaeon]|nr:hypothetical protein [Candidatus Aenigmarchaeota archaeon]
MKLNKNYLKAGEELDRISPVNIDVVGSRYPQDVYGSPVNAIYSYKNPVGENIFGWFKKVAEWIDNLPGIRHLNKIVGEVQYTSPNLPVPVKSEYRSMVDEALGGHK